MEVAATPFIVLVSVLPDNANVFVVEGMIPARLIAVLETPLTVVVKLFPAKVLEIKFTMGTAVLATPLTVVVKLFIDEVLDTAFIIGTAVPVIPFTVVVKLLGAIFVLLTVVVTGAAAAGSQLEVVVL